jgi:enoyl-CoA hydratase
MLARLIGPVRTRDLMFTGRTLTAEEAVDWGMVARRVPHEQLMATARIGMTSSLGAPESVEGLPGVKERRSPNWVHADLQIDGRL